MLPCSSKTLKIGKFQSLTLSNNTSSSLELGSLNSPSSFSDCTLSPLSLLLSSEAVRCPWHLQLQALTLSWSFSLHSVVTLSRASCMACASSLLTRRKAPPILSGALRSKLGEDITCSGDLLFPKNDGAPSGDNFLWMTGEPCGVKLFGKYSAPRFVAVSCEFGFAGGFTTTAGLSTVPSFGELRELDDPWISGLGLLGEDDRGVLPVLSRRGTDRSGSTVGIPVAEVVVVQVLDMRRPGEFIDRRMRWNRWETNSSRKIQQHSQMWHNICWGYTSGQTRDWDGSLTLSPTSSTSEFLPLGILNKNFG